MEGATIEELKTLVVTKQGRVDSMLELTKAVNSNFSRSALMKLFEFILLDRFKLEKFVLKLKNDSLQYILVPNF